MLDTAKYPRSSSGLKRPHDRSKVDGDCRNADGCHGTTRPIVLTATYNEAIPGMRNMDPQGAHWFTAHGSFKAFGFWYHLWRAGARAHKGGWGFDRLLN